MAVINKEHSFKKRLAISYIALIVSIGFLISLVYYIYSFSVIEEQTLYAAKSFRKMAHANATYNKEYLEPIIKNLIKIKTENTADELSPLILKCKDVRDNPDIEKLSSQPIISKGIVIGNMQLVDSNKKIIYSGDKPQIGQNLDRIKKNYKNLHKMIDNGINKKEEFSGYYEIPKVQKFLDAVKIPNTNYYLVSSVIVHDYLDPILSQLKEHEEKEVAVLISDINELHKDSVIILVMVTLFILFILLFVCFFISHWLAKKVASPITNLQKAVQKIGDGDFETKVDETGTSETVQLAQSFNKLGGKLEQYINNLKQEINLRKQVESELEIARKIQKVLLPEITDEFIRPEFTLYADLLAAKDVAGDHFDFQYLDKEKTKLAVILGDVSDKGMAAAIGMAVISTVIRSLLLANNKLEPAQLLKEVNERLLLKNPECIFDCIFFGILDINTLEFTYANAGHHAALKVTKSGKIEEFGLLNNPSVGIIPNIEYNQEKITIQPGESIVLYTDGLSEAVSNSGEEYTKDRIKENLIKNITKTPEEICNTIFKDVLIFQNNIIYDDMTIVYLKINK
jgi:serine phosphatase RsbU (regulator of sigma subunit)